MKKYTIFILIIFFFSCNKENNLNFANIKLKGIILGENVSLNENNLNTDYIEIGEPINSRIFLSTFAEGNMAYTLLLTLPKDSIYNSLKFPIQETGAYGFEKFSGNVTSSPFQFSVSEKIRMDYKIYSTFSNNDSNKIIIFEIESETDSTIIISGAFDCNLTLLTNQEISGKAKNVEFKTRFLIK